MLLCLSYAVWCQNCQRTLGTIQHPHCCVLRQPSQANSPDIQRYVQCSTNFCGVNDYLLYICTTNFVLSHQVTSSVLITCVCVHARTRVGVCGCARSHVRGCVGVHARTRGYVGVHARTRGYVGVHARTRVCVCVCMYPCLCMCVFLMVEW